MSGPRLKRASIWAVVVLILVFLAAPTLVVLAVSFTSGNIVAFPPDGFSLRWYAALIEASDVRRAFGRSLYVAVIATLIAVPAGTLASLALARYTLRGRSLIEVYLLLPFTVPLIVSGLGMMLVFGELRVLGALWPVGVAAAAINLPFVVWAVGASVANLDPNLEDAAASLGATPLTAFFTVTVPALMPGIVTGALIMFILAFNEFIVSLMLTDARTVTMPVQIYNQIRSVITPDLAAVSVVYILIALAAIWLLDRTVGLDLFLRSK